MCECVSECYCSWKEVKPQTATIQSSGASVVSTSSIAPVTNEISSPTSWSQQQNYHINQYQQQQQHQQQQHQQPAVAASPQIITAQPTQASVSQAGFAAGFSSSSTTNAAPLFSSTTTSTSTLSSPSSSSTSSSTTTSSPSSSSQAAHHHAADTSSRHQHNQSPVTVFSQPARAFKPDRLATIDLIIVVIYLCLLISTSISVSSRRAYVCLSVCVSAREIVRESSPKSSVSRGEEEEVEERSSWEGGQ